MPAWKRASEILRSPITEMRWLPARGTSTSIRIESVQIGAWVSNSIWSRARLAAAGMSARRSGEFPASKALARNSPTSRLDSVDARAPVTVAVPRSIAISSSSTTTPDGPISKDPLLRRSWNGSSSCSPEIHWGSSATDQRPIPFRPGRSICTSRPP